MHCLLVTLPVVLDMCYEETLHVGMYNRAKERCQRHYNLCFLLYYNDINIYMDFLIDSNITLVRFNCLV